MLWKGIQGTLKNILHEDSRTRTYVFWGLSIYISGTVPSVLRNSDLEIIPLNFWRPESSPLSKSPQCDSCPQGLLAWPGDGGGRLCRDYGPLVPEREK